MDEAKKYTFENPEYRKRYWHTSSHIMAQAVKRSAIQQRISWHRQSNVCGRK